MDHRAINRSNWNSRADIHVGARSYALKKVADPSWLSHVVAFDRPRLGARMTGLDLSPRFIEHARRIAAENKVPVDYVVSDVYQAVEVLGSGRFDRVYTGMGHCSEHRQPQHHL